MSKVEIKIEGMTCGHCAMTITKELSGLAGVASVQVDHQAGSAVVEQNGLSNDQLSEVITAAGYTAKENGPISVEFLGRPYSEPVLFKLAYAYEQASKNRKPAALTPALPGDKFNY